LLNVRFSRKYKGFCRSLCGQRSIERLWKFVKSEVLNAAYHGAFLDFKNAIDNCVFQTDKCLKPQMDVLISEKVQLFDAFEDVISAQLPLAA